eukprot:GDKJ01064633.1.p1 GENE.GDKJ01064633.1~~GDKJ01064633.1.p1  ORF type:complete len:1083 (+),score=195.18 GDKJ01064633.1:1-3249(+)
MGLTQTLMLRNTLIGLATFSEFVSGHNGERPTNVPRDYLLINYGEGSLEKTLESYGSPLLNSESASEITETVLNSRGSSLRDAVMEYTNGQKFITLSAEKSSNVVEYQPLRIHVHNTVTNLSPAMKDALVASMSFLEESLKVVRAQENLRMNPRYEKCFKAMIPTEHRSEGVSATDFILYVTDSTSFCGSSTLGWAVSCFNDQNDRPVAGQLNICTNNMDPSADSAGSVAYAAAFFAHEVMHALGFASDTLPFFRDGETRELLARSHRDQYGSPPINAEGYFTADKSTFEGVVFKPKTSKSPNKHLQSAITAGYLVTPSVRLAVQRHFGCDSLKGAAFEDEGGDGSQGSHFERRIFGPELMTGVMATRPRASPLSLAVLEDSGWYLPNYYAVPEMIWGREMFLRRDGIKTCEFAMINPSNYKADGNPNGNCPVSSAFSSKNGQNLGSDRHLCVGSETRDSCLPDGTGAGRCFYKDFGNGCRVRDIYHSTGTLNADSSCTRDVQGNHASGDYHGVYSRCVDNSIYDGRNTQGSCYPLKCGLAVNATLSSVTQVQDGYDTSDMALMYDRVDITVNKNSQTPVVVRCFSNEVGLKKNVPGSKGTIVCPDVSKVCAGAPCLNGGFFKANRCVCQPGYVGQYCQFEARNEIFEKKIPSRVHWDSIEASTLLVGKNYESVPAYALKDHILESILGKEEAAKRQKTLTNRSSAVSGVEYELISRLPAGLSLDRNTGVISGSPLYSSPCSIVTIALRYTGNFQPGEETRISFPLETASETPTAIMQGGYKSARASACSKLGVESLTFKNSKSLGGLFSARKEDAEEREALFASVAPLFRQKEDGSQQEGESASSEVLVQGDHIDEKDGEGEQVLGSDDIEEGELKLVNFGSSIRETSSQEGEIQTSNDAQDKGFTTLTTPNKGDLFDYKRKEEEEEKNRIMSVEVTSKAEAIPYTMNPTMVSLLKLLGTPPNLEIAPVPSTFDPLSNQDKDGDSIVHPSERSLDLTRNAVAVGIAPVISSLGTKRVNYLVKDTNVISLNGISQGFNNAGDEDLGANTISDDRSGHPSSAIEPEIRTISALIFAFIVGIRI